MVDGLAHGFGKRGRAKGEDGKRRGRERVEI